MRADTRHTYQLQQTQVLEQAQVELERRVSERTVALMAAKEDAEKANGRNLLSLIDSVLDLSKVETGHMELDVTSVPLTDIVRETIPELEPQAHARRVHLVLDSHPRRACLKPTAPS